MHICFAIWFWVTYKRLCESPAAVSWQRYSRFKAGLQRLLIFTLGSPTMSAIHSDLLEEPRECGKPFFSASQGRERGKEKRKGKNCSPLDIALMAVHCSQKTAGGAEISWCAAAATSRTTAAQNASGRTGQCTESGASGTTLQMHWKKMSLCLRGGCGSMASRSDGQAQDCRDVSGSNLPAYLCTEQTL